MRASGWTVLVGIAAASCGGAAKNAVDTPAPVSADQIDQLADIGLTLAQLSGEVGNKLSRMVEMRLTDESRAVSECMDVFGFAGYPVSIYHQSDSAYEQGLISLYWWWAPSDLEKSLRMGYGFTTQSATAPRVDTSDYQGFEQLDEAGQAAHNAALNKCVASQPATWSMETLAPDAAALANDLQMRLTEASLVPDYSSRAVDPYQACMKENGLEDPYPLDSVQSALKRVGFYEANRSGNPPKDVLAAAQAAERAVAAIDLSCRAEVLDEVASLLMPVYREWMRQHESEVKAAIDGWAALGD